jgi:hypothetical protein
VPPAGRVNRGRHGFAPAAGLEKLDRTLVQDREAQRRALDRVLHDPPSKDPAYLAALRTLGARAELVAECKKL